MSRRSSRKVNTVPSYAEADEVPKSEAAEKAANDTAGMICRVGRASRLGARTLGCPDPGAVSFSIILRAMADWLTESGKAA